MRRIAAFAVAIVVVGIAGTGWAAPPPAYFVDETKLPFGALAGTSTTRYWGVHGGAGYRIEVPDNWNGELVLYAHGFRGTGLELTITNPAIRAYLIRNGFAWGASSYAKNGYDVKQGVKDTHALGELFNGIVSHPSRTYIMGHSMGGHITGVAIEQYPQAYDGALPMCGVMGDDRLFDFFLDYNFVAEKLAGIDPVFPFQANYFQLTPTIKAALGPNFPFVLNAKGEQLKSMTMWDSGGARPLFDVAFQSWGDFLLGRSIGDGTIGVAPGNVASNVDTFYQLDNDSTHSAAEQAFNADILRVDSSPQGRQNSGLANVPPVNGDIGIPTITLHTIGDLFVPFSMEEIYRDRVAAHGASDLLVQRAIRDVGHCGFTVPEQEQAFADLVNWVENGVHPAGDDLSPASVADPKFGCLFTLTKRSYAPAC